MIDEAYRKRAQKNCFANFGRISACAEAGKKILRKDDWDSPENLQRLWDYAEEIKIVLHGIRSPIAGASLSNVQWHTPDEKPPKFGKYLVTGQHRGRVFYRLLTYTETDGWDLFSGIDPDEDITHWGFPPPEWMKIYGENH